ncbi:MAG: LuxR C-terminal-related transcriptional regulator, partial [Verrucomicrobiota bacterium]
CVKHEPDFVILDVMLPELNGVEVLSRLKRDIPNAHILVFSGVTSKAVIKRVLRAGVSGYIEKDAGIDELENAIRRVAEGQSYFGPRIVEAMQEIMMNGGEDGGIECLTSREREILQLIAESCSNKEIAAKLCISARTADTHRTNIMRKLNIHDVAGLTRYALSNGLILNESSSVELSTN